MLLEAASDAAADDDGRIDDDDDDVDVCGHLLRTAAVLAAR